MLHLKCSQCGAEYDVDDSLAGAAVECAVCNHKFTITAEAPGGLVDRQPVVAAPVPLAKAAPVAPVVAAPVAPGQAVPAAPVPARHLPPRLRRLANDYQLLQQVFHGSSHVRINRVEGDPPTRYEIALHLPGVERVVNGEPVLRDDHLVEIVLTSTCPRTAPMCRMLTPIFHPNIEPAVICIGDHWTAAERLCDLVVRIGEMIQYQSYNNRSPLDGEAAMWADLHEADLPVGTIDLMADWA